jgi:hypothetical protein
LTGLKKKKKNKKCGETQIKTTDAANFDKDGKGVIMLIIGVVPFKVNKKKKKRLQSRMNDRKKL